MKIDHKLRYDVAETYFIIKMAQEREFLKESVSDLQNVIHSLESDNSPLNSTLQLDRWFNKKTNNLIEISVQCLKMLQSGTSRAPGAVDSSSKRQTSQLYPLFCSDWLSQPLKIRVQRIMQRNRHLVFREEIIIDPCKQLIMSSISSCWQMLWNNYRNGIPTLDENNIGERKSVDQVNLRPVDIHLLVQKMTVGCFGFARRRFIMVTIMDITLTGHFLLIHELLIKPSTLFASKDVILRRLIWGFFIRLLVATGISDYNTIHCYTRITVYEHIASGCSDQGGLKLVTTRIYQELHTTTAKRLEKLA
ncbi:hypothetical protein OUZ56_019960 [Daphnia magna]|uniref:Uncharacterized protein n=1 Tax=Daphnia magna TaxID=35525 RepID=A0ABQ9ZD45_9CRUS|nr:hypothetical protein OUZ56_019960 [Daphnia magna]